MEYDNKRVIERILLILKYQDISINKFGILTLLPESTVRGIFRRRRLMNIDLIHRLYLSLTKHTPAHDKKRITDAFFEMLFADEVSDKAVLTVLECDMGVLSWSQIKCTTCFSYDDERVAAFLEVIRTKGYGLALRPMAKLPFAPTAPTLLSYEQGKTRPCMEYLFGLILQLPDPAAFFMEMITPPGLYREHSPTPETLKSIVETFVLPEEKRAALVTQARQARQRNKKRN